MTKRKAENEAECPILIKNLRRSITDFITQNKITDIHSDKSSIEFLDYSGDIWQNYEQRLDTFDVKFRSSKPKEVSPVECSRHGWKNDGDDFLFCDDCGNVLCVKMPNGDISNRVYNHCIWNIQRKLVEAHSVVCRWRTNVGLSTTTPYDISARYKILVQSGQQEVSFERGVVDEAILQKFGVDNAFFLLMAIFGWLPAEKNAEDIHFKCNLCGRRLNCTIFSEELPLNPREQHHFYCPVIDKIYPLWQESLANVHKLKKKEPLIPTMWNVKNLVKRIFDDGVEEKKSVDELDVQKETGGLVADNTNGQQGKQSTRKSMDEFDVEKNNQTIRIENAQKPKRKSI